MTDTDSFTDSQTSTDEDDILGCGCYGTVVKAFLQDSKQEVALKIPKEGSNFDHEASMMEFLMQNYLNEWNIVVFYGRSDFNKQALVYELLDMTLLDYLCDLDQPMLLRDIRTVIEHVAVALEGLKTVGVIHSDLKPDNIMMVDQTRRPFTVKLIDFGLAIPKSQAKKGSTVQPYGFRAPEIMIGLPFSEAIDVWSLGCVMAYMMYNTMIFTQAFTYGQLEIMINLMGPPPQHLLQAGCKTCCFFKKTDSGQWVFKTNEEYYGDEEFDPAPNYYDFTSLDETKMVRLEEDNENEEKERDECVELLKAMFQWDEEERIAPDGILKHPFITQGSLNNSPCEPKPSTGYAQTRTNDNLMYPGVIMVQPASPKHRTSLEEANDQDNLKDPESTNIQMDPEQPTTSGNTKEQKNNKKKKSCFRRFLSWVRKKFISCGSQ